MSRSPAVSFPTPRWCLLCVLLVTLVGLLVPACDGPGKSLTTEAAAERAANLANDEAARRYDHRPFQTTSGTAVFKRDATGKDQWHWTARVGFGLGDLFATVSFERDGTKPVVTVRYLVSPVPQSSF